MKLTDNQDRHKISNKLSEFGLNVYEYRAAVFFIRQFDTFYFLLPHYQQHLDWFTDFLLHELVTKHHALVPVY